MIPNIFLQQRTIVAILGTFIIFIIATVAYNAWQWHHDWSLSYQTSAAKHHETFENQPTPVAADYHLFGQSLNGDVPITSLQFRVTGIVKIEDEQGQTVSKAYISESGQPSKIYQVGDILPYDVKVYAINADAVILENDGKIEKLPLPRQPLEFKPREQVEL